MDITIDRKSPVPIYLQIVQSIRELITSGTLPEGFVLPPERQLAKALGVNRSTILSAYRELKADSLVDSHVGRGTRVLPQPFAAGGRSDVRMLSWGQLFREGRERSPDPLLRDLLALSERSDVISFSIGLPAPESLPLREFHSIQGRLLKEVGPQIFSHCPTEGHTPLRETLVQLMADRGVDCDLSELLILSGSQQGLDLTARVFIDPGDTVIVEDPSYFGALQVFRAARARLVGIPIDEKGMCTDVLASVLERHRPKLIYTLPTFQNPSTAVLSLERRKHLLDLAYRYQVPVLEDDPYSELRYDGQDIPSLKALDKHGFVMHLKTFSKVMFPGLRIGWIVAPRQVIQQFVLVKQSTDLHSNTPGQWIFDRFIKDGLYEPHVQKLRSDYAKRRDAMATELDRIPPPDFSWHKPSGGFYFWCRLPRGIQRSHLLSRAAEAGVSFLPGWPCFTNDNDESYIRLNFTSAQVEKIPEGVRRLFGAVRQASFQTSLPRRGGIGQPPVV